MSQLSRWWTYQRERFPLLKTGALVAVLSFSAATMSGVLGGRHGLPPVRAVVVAFVVLMGFFAQLRIADEHKDYADDAQFRPYRPVPRGLVTLGELRIWALGIAIVQAGLSALLAPALLVLLIAVWAYLGLMTAEFFVPEWLRSRPLVYLLSHMAIMPLIVLFATACEWVTAGARFPPSLGWFLAMGFFNGIVLEVGRKLRARSDEETGVETYTSLYGPRRAVAGWLAAVAASGIMGLVAALGGVVSPTGLLALAAIFLAAWATCAFAAWRFVANPVSATARRLEPLAGIWLFVSYLAIASVPLVVAR